MEFYISCRTFFRLVSEFTEGLRARTCLPIMSQTCSVEFKSGLHAGQSIRSIPTSSRILSLLRDVRTGTFLRQNEAIPKKWALWHHMLKNNIPDVGPSCHSTFITDMQFCMCMGGNTTPPSIPSHPVNSGQKCKPKGHRKCSFADGQWSRKGYRILSQILNRPEYNHCVTRKELLVVVKSVKHFHKYMATNLYYEQIIPPQSGCKISKIQEDK